MDSAVRPAAVTAGRPASPRRTRSRARASASPASLFPSRPTPGRFLIPCPRISSAWRRLYQNAHRASRGKHINFREPLVDRPASIRLDLPNDGGNRVRWRNHRHQGPMTPFVSHLFQIDRTVVRPDATQARCQKRPSVPLRPRFRCLSYNPYEVDVVVRSMGSHPDLPPWTIS
jgi:hypothetical protein